MITPVQMNLGLTPAHRNQYLFSDHYLNHLLPEDPCWTAALAEAGSFLAWLHQLYAEEHAQLPHYSEAQLEDHWIKPILKQLGHIFEPQASLYPVWSRASSAPTTSSFPMKRHARQLPDCK
jgi:hypothetical protein